MTTERDRDDDRRAGTTPDPSADGGPEVEKWILRVLLVGVIGAAVAALVASVDDIKRYVHIRQM